MAFTISYGTYVHEAPVMPTRFTSQAILNPRGRPDRRLNTVSITGLLLGSSVATLTTKLENLRAAYIQQGLQFLIYDSNGALTPLSLPAPTIRGPNHSLQIRLEPGQAHYTTGIPYTVTLEAEYPAIAPDPLLLWEDSITYQGSGGPRYVMPVPDFGLPVAQQVSETSPQIITQRGRAVGRDSYPTFQPVYSITTPTGDIYPVHDGNLISRQSAGVIGNTFHGYPISWQFQWMARGPQLELIPVSQ